MKIKKYRYLIAIALGILLIMTSIIPIIKISKGKNTSGDLNDNDSNIIKLEYEDVKVYAEEGNYEVIAERFDSAGVDINSSFKIKSKEKVNISDIKKTLKISPKENYEIKKISNKEFVVSIKDSLKSDSIYNISLFDNKLNKEVSWAFQTKRRFKILGTLPGNGSTYVPVDSGIEIRFTHNNIKDLEKHFEITPSVEGRFEYHKNTVVFIPKSLEKNTDYNVKISKGLSIKDSEEKLEEDYEFTFRTQTENNNDTKYFGFLNDLLSINSNTTPYLEVMCDSFFKDKEMKVEIFKYNNEDDFLINIKENDEKNYYRYYDYYNKNSILFKTENLSKVSELNTKILANDIGSFDRYMGGKFIALPDTLDEGHYLISVSYKDYIYQTHLQVNDITSYVMITEKEAFVWANDSKENSPINNASVILNEKDKTTTNNEGIAIINSNVDKDKKYNYVKISRENRPSFIVSMRNNYHYNYHSDIDRKYFNYMYLDRNMYLPNDSVKIWGFIKDRNNKNNPKKGTLYLYKSIYRNGNHEYELQKQAVNISDYGTFEGNFKFSDLNAGGYYITFKIGEEVIRKEYFTVKEYTKPIYTLNSNFEKDVVFSWEDVNLNVEGKFFDGTPAGGLNLKYFYYLNGNRKEKDTKLDKDGKTHLKLNLDKNTTSWRPYNVYFNIYNSNAEEAEVRTSNNILVFPRDTMILVNRNIDENKATLEFEVNKIDISKYKKSYDYNDYKGETIDTDLDINIYEILYEKIETGETYDFINKKVIKQYRYDKVRKLIDEKNIKTVDGLYNMEVNIEDNKDYEVIVKLKDTRGRSITENIYLNTYMGNRYSSNKKNFTLKDDNEKYKYRIGEVASYNLLLNDEEIEHNDRDKTLFIRLNNGLLDYKISDDTKYSFEFTKDFIPNIYLKAVYLDDGRIYKTYEEMVRYDSNEKELKIDIIPDKESYKPGENVNLKIYVKDEKENPVKADVNISVVDEAFFALNDQYVNTLNDVYTYLYGSGVISDYVSYKEIDIDGRTGAEGGGEGDDEYIRTDFKDSAFFKTVRTNENGYSEVSFKIPDNLTSWRITYQGISDEIYVGNGKMNIATKLPFFLNTILNKTFIEGDDIYISSRVNGTEVDKNDLINYEVDLEDENGAITSIKASKNAGDYTNIYLGKLKKGKYKITTKAKNDLYFDGVERKFEVVDCILKTNSVSYYKLDENININSDSKYSTLKFYNEENIVFNKALNKAKYSYGQRVDVILGRVIGTDISNKYFGENIEIEDNDLKQYQLNDGGIGLLPYDSSDVLLSAKVSLINNNIFDKLSLSNYFYRKIEDKESSLEEIVAAYLGLASLKEPVLLDVRNMLSNEELNLKEKLYLALALSELGDHYKAQEIYIDLLNSYGKKLGNYMLVKIGNDKDDYIEYTALMSILSLNLNQNEKNSLFSYCVDNSTKDILINLESLMYITRALPKVNTAVKFNINHNGKETLVDLSKNNTYSMFLSSDELSKLKFSNIVGDITVEVNSEVKIIDIMGNNENDIKLSRTYNKEKYKQSDLVKITITPSFTSESIEGYYEITDILPSGFRYIGGSGRDKNLSYPYLVSGQKLVFGYYYNVKSRVKPIVYYARAVLPGNYIADNAVIKHVESNSLGFTERKEITIEE